MRSFHLSITHTNEVMITSFLTIEARNHDDAMDQGLIVLGLDYNRVDRIVATPLTGKFGPREFSGNRK